MEDKHYETMIAPTTFNEWDLETLRVFDLEDNPMKQYGMNANCYKAKHRMPNLN